MVQYKDLQVGDRIVVLPYSAYEDEIDINDRGCEGEVFTVKEKCYNEQRGEEAIIVEEDDYYYWYPVMFEPIPEDELTDVGDDALLDFLG